MSHPDLQQLSQLLDSELTPAEAADLDTHVSACDPCRARMHRLDALGFSSLEVARGESALAPAKRRDCPGTSGLSGWRDPALPASQRAALLGHLEHCDACLIDVMQATRLLARLDATPALAVPGPLRARVDAMLGQTSPARELSRIAVRIVRAGAELLESHVLAPLRDLTLLPAPLAATRSDASGLSFQLRAPDAVITTTILPAGDNLGVTLALANEAGEPLMGQRVYLRRHGRSLYSARTDDTGTLRLPVIARGVYEVACPGLATAFHLDLHE